MPSFCHANLPAFKQITPVGSGIIFWTRCSAHAKPKQLCAKKEAERIQFNESTHLALLCAAVYRTQKAGETLKLSTHRVVAVAQLAPGAAPWRPESRVSYEARTTHMTHIYWYYWYVWYVSCIQVHAFLKNRKGKSSGADIFSSSLPVTTWLVERFRVDAETHQNPSLYLKH